MIRSYKGWIINKSDKLRYPEVYEAKKDGVCIVGKYKDLIGMLKKRENEDCKWLQDEVCTNDRCDQLADFVDKTYCLGCRLWECEDETLGEYIED